MKTFQQFITEARADDDPDIHGLGHGTGTTHRAGEKIGSDMFDYVKEKING